MSYSKIILDGDITLSWSYPVTTDYIAGDINDVISNNSSYTITLPSAQSIAVGTSMLFNNVGNEDFTILLNDGTPLSNAIISGEINQIYLVDSSMPAGTWRLIPFGGGSSGIINLSASSSNDALLINHGTVIPPSGNIEFSIAESLSNFNDLTTQVQNGFTVITANNPMEFTSRVLDGGENIELSNADGVGGDPIISVSNDLTNLSLIEVGNFRISGNEINSISTNSDLGLSTNGAGNLVLNGITIDTDSNISVNNLTVNGSFNSPLLASSWCVFTDTITGETNKIVLEVGYGIDSVTGSGGSYIINFANEMASINYGVNISLASNGSTLPPPVYHAFWTVRDTTSLTIAVLDSSGEFVASFPDGVTVVIMDK